MAFYERNCDRKRTHPDYRRQEEEIDDPCHFDSRPSSPKTLLEQEKRIRREIANSNERRRMMSINEGFQSLRNLLSHKEGEKLSKAAILQHTADYITQLEKEKTRLLDTNRQLSKRLMNPHLHHDSDGSGPDSPLSKRRKRERGENIEREDFLPDRATAYELRELKREVVELRDQLERERTLRGMFQKQVRNLAGESDASKHMRLQHDGTAKDCIKCTSNGYESGLGSPLSQISSPDIDSFRELSPSPDDPAAKNTILSRVLASDVHYGPICIPGLIRVSSYDSPPQHHIEFPKESASRQNLETIVEAIRIVEGDHLFQDDPKPNNLSVPRLKDSIQLSVSEHDYTKQFNSSLSQESKEFSIKDHIIRNAPVTQARPNVIVPNLL